jgi:O-Antigen ligase
VNARVARLPGAIAALNPLRPLWAVGRWLGRVVEPAPPTLGGYAPQKAPTRHALVKRSIYALIIFVGIFYGLMVAVFPMFLYLYMAIPIVFLALLIIWALPETDKVPERAMEWLFWAFLVSLLAWPNYLAVSLPGLPWITAQRLFLIPLTVLLLSSFSISSEYRQRAMQVFRANRWISGLMLVFVATQFLTIPFSDNISDATNRFVSNQFSWTLMFVIGCMLFVKDGRTDKWLRWVSIMVILLCILGIFEYRQQGVLWAGHIPSFLAVADESVQRTLAGGTRSGTGMYRLQGTFATPLNFAEVLGLSTVLFIHAIFRARQFWQKALVAAYIPGHFMIIWGTDSRLGMIGFFGSFLAYLFIWSLNRWKSKPNDIFAPLLVLGYPVILTIFIGLSLTWQRLGSFIWGGGAQQASNDARRAQWATFWPKFFRWPFGHGPGGSGEALGYANGAGVLTVDSYYISIALDYGVIGFFAFYGVLIATIITSLVDFAKSRQSEYHMLLPATVILGLFLVIKSVLSQEGGHALIFMLIGMVAALHWRATVQDSETDIKRLKQE